MNETLPKLLEDATLEDSTLPPTSTKEKPLVSHITEFPMEMQVNILTYLRAYDLATVHQTCRYYQNPVLVHAIVVHASEQVYPAELTQGFEQQPVMSISNSAAEDSKPAAKKGKKKGPPTKKAPPPVVSTVTQYTFEHLRNMELLVVARVLSRPEPSLDENGVRGGYYVSKSWCKTALLWLEWQQERQQQLQQQQAVSGNGKKNKKLSKKQQRLRQRKYSDASPPWPNANSDIVCCHQQLSLCRNSKSSRARRKVLDKQAWKCLKKLYPESISLDAKQGECLQCILEAETEKKTQQQREEELKEERKAPLAQPELRRFYTRSRGVPVHCLKEKATGDESRRRSSKQGGCPLVPGVYYCLPRAWCHAWRKYMKTGEGAGTLLPPDASALLCDFHRICLLPPHLEAYLYGETPQLWFSKKQQQLEEESQHLDESASSLGFGSPVARRRSVVGMSDPRAAMMPSPAELGLSAEEVALQQRAMMTLERRREQQQIATLQQQQQQQDENGGRRSSIMQGEQLDRENYCCVEILAPDELEALEKLWPRGTCFRLSFEVLPGGGVAFCTPPCRECDASGMADFCKMSKNKAQVRAAHQARVRIYNNQKTSHSISSPSGGVSTKPGVQLEY